MAKKVFCPILRQDIRSQGLNGIFQFIAKHRHTCKFHFMCIGIPSILQFWGRSLWFAFSSNYEHTQSLAESITIAEYSFVKGQYTGSLPNALQGFPKSFSRISDFIQLRFFSRSGAYGNWILLGLWQEAVILKAFISRTTRLWGEFTSKFTIFKKPCP